MTIISDIDGVLNDLVPKTLELYNSRTGKNISISDITTYNFADCLPKEDADGIVELFKEKELWDSLSPLFDAQMYLKELLNEGHQIYLATATDPINFEWKCQWIAKYFPFIAEDKIIRIIDKSLLRADVMIEDCLDNLIGNICERIVMDHPWNRDKSKEYAYDIHRAYNFKDVIDIIHNIEKESKKWENE